MGLCGFAIRACACALGALARNSCCSVASNRQPRAQSQRGKRPVGARQGGSSERRNGPSPARTLLKISHLDCIAAF